MNQIVQGAGLDALGRGTIQFSQEGKAALALVTRRKCMVAANGGLLSPRDRGNLIRRCRQLGFDNTWIRFVLGVQ